MSYSILSSSDLILNRTPIVRDVDFSNYPGYDRVLFVVDGVLKLAIDGRAVRLAGRQFHIFPGEAAVTAVVCHQPSLVFNVLAARDSWTIGAVLALTEAQAFKGTGLAVIHSAEGACELAPLAPLGDGHTLVTKETVHLGQPEGWVAACYLRAREA